jgi:hypothetical protein
MIQAYCSNCKQDLGILPGLVCDNSMICKICFSENYLNNLFNEDTEMIIKIEEAEKI